ncbi:DUF1801 domain-containing protein [Pseudonocardia sp. H11422]|uniref:DUF1801 domain-containing protein n=1 Tax=Pseudonocardia sp. H11422 TaxID=2835866 RepID=UPI001BDC4F3F|nr:DUF1801 domain-containing protein [Pseudonocardia sp. H11422]
MCREVRELVHAADREVVETIKRTRQPYFVLNGNVCALLAAKDHVNVFVYDGGIVPDPEGIITGGHDNNRVGGWRRIKRGVDSSPSLGASGDEGIGPSGGTRGDAFERGDPGQRGDQEPS